ncbi:MAG: thiamine pyrophosphate-binding protein, partial [Thermoanaerobaculia bacterium]
MDNVHRAARLIDDVRAAGVTDVCVCAGSRNSPLLVVLGTRDDMRLFSFVDERSAAFFAIGRAKALDVPVAIVTTSGTAAAELLPATIEAYYSGLPLVLVTADRPARFRGTGAPQCIEQVELFGPYAATSL